MEREGDGYLSATYGCPKVMSNCVTDLWHSSRLAQIPKFSPADRHRYPNRRSDTEDERHRYLIRGCQLEFRDFNLMLLDD